MSLPLSYELPKVTETALPMGLLATAGFLSVAGGRVIDSLLVAIAVDFHTTVPALSIALAAYSLTYGVNQIFLGPLGDRWGKLRIMLCALIGYAIATAGCALADGVNSLTLLRALAGAASGGLVPLSLAYIGDHTTFANRQVQLSRFLLGVNVAQIIAGPLGGIFGDTIGWRGVFLLFAAAGIAAATALAIRMPSLPRGGTGSVSGWAAYKLVFSDRWARLLLLGTMIDGMVMSGCFPFIAPYLKLEFDLSYASVGMIIGLYGVGGIAYSRFARILLGKLGERGLILGGGTLMATGMAAACLSPVWIGFLAIQFALGLGFFMLHGTLQARATEMAPEARATAVSCFVFFLFLGQTIGALLTGVMIAAHGYIAAFATDAVLLLALTAWLVHLLASAPGRAQKQA